MAGKGISVCQRHVPPANASYRLVLCPLFFCPVFVPLFVEVQEVHCGKIYPFLWVSRRASFVSTLPYILRVCDHAQRALRIMWFVTETMHPMVC